LDGLRLINSTENLLQVMVEQLLNTTELACALEAAVGKAVNNVAKSWEARLPVPPAIIWKPTLQQAQDISERALKYWPDRFPGQTNSTEVSFGWVSETTPRSNLS
jgi:hypothetical protein